MNRQFLSNYRVQEIPDEQQSLFRSDQGGKMIRILISFMILLVVLAGCNFPLIPGGGNPANTKRRSADRQPAHGNGGDAHLHTLRGCAGAGQ